jgi:zinc protease
MSHDFTKIQEYALGEGGRLFIAATGTHDLVIVEGSVLGGPNMLPRQRDVLPALAASLLDAGTAKRSKAAIREGLAAKGISLAFGARGDRTSFAGQCFPEYLPALLEVIVECLGQASFPQAEVLSAKTRALGALAEERSNTRAQAERKLTELVYDPTHVNYACTLAEDEKRVRALTRADFQMFRTLLGRGGLVLAIAGDVSAAAARASAEKAFGRLGHGTTAVPEKRANQKSPRAIEERIHIADKANIDTCFGASVPMTLEHPLYHALRVGADMLGGGPFTTHLMRTIRERDGLTYAIQASLPGFRVDTDGCFEIWANFTPPRFDESVSKTLEEIQIFLKTGVTPTALQETKERVVGSYAVSLATTQNLASALHALGVNGRPLSYLAEYPRIITALTVTQVKSALALVPFDKLSIAAAGTFK